MRDRYDFSDNDLAGKVAKWVGLSAVMAMGMLLAKSGVFQSAEARKKRNSDERLVDAPRVGTPLLVALARGSAEHTGIYLGDSRVAELSGDGQLQEVTLTEFINGKSEDWNNLRSGTRIFSACDEAQGVSVGMPFVADVARQFIHQVRRVDYHLFGNNCHMFTASCVKGEMISKLSKVEWFMHGTFSVDILTNLISKTLNNGRPVAWLGVRGPTPQFDYELTEEKLSRLRTEGKKCEGDVC